MRRGLGIVIVIPIMLAGGAHAATASGATRDVGTAKHARARGGPIARAASVSYMGGPVLPANRTHLIFWRPEGSGLSFDPGYASTIETFLARVAADSHLQSNVYGLTGQYGDAGSAAAYASSYGGATIDTNPLPTPTGCAEPPPPPAGEGPPGWNACVSDQQIQTELSHLVAADRLPTTSSDVYFLITPAGLGDCELAGPDSCALGGSVTGYCGYHSVTSATGIVYAVIPFNAVPGHCQSDNPRPNSSSADPAITTLAHEHAEVVTDPLRTAWFDSQSNEIADLCITDYGPNLGGSRGATAYDELIHGGRYYLQELWSNADGRCEPSVQPDVVSFAAPRTFSGDRSLTLTGVASDRQGRIVSYRWSFGDGRDANGRQTKHVFVRRGNVSVRLRTTDSWRNWAFASRTVRVTVPPRPVAVILAAPARIAASFRPRFRFGSSAAIASFQCSLDNGAWTACRSPFTTRRLSRAAHRFSVRARDTFGQLSTRPASSAFRVV